MKIKIVGDAACGTVPIPAAEYWVSLHSETSEIMLSAAGKDIRLKATRRRSQSKSKTTTVQYFSGGGKTWSLVVNAPKYGEWVSFIELK